MDFFLNVCLLTFHEYLQSSDCVVFIDTGFSLLTFSRIIQGRLGNWDKHDLCGICFSEASDTAVHAFNREQLLPVLLPCLQHSVYGFSLATAVGES